MIQNDLAANGVDDARERGRFRRGATRPGEGRLRSWLLLAAACCALLGAEASAQTSLDKRGLDGLPEKPFAQLSDRSVSPLGQAALAIRPAEWKHGETTNFVYHFFHGFIATAVSVEAEFYYRVIAKELARDTAQWERKCHIFIFEQPEDWTLFQTKAHLDPWTGGIHAGGELFIQRDPSYKFKGPVLGHEVAHLVVHRFFGNGVPLWLNEGYAEYVSGRAYAAYQRARGYFAKPHSRAVAAADYLPVEMVTGAVSYPAASPQQLVAFYCESERLVRLLSRDSREKFLVFLDAMSQGNRIETALWKAFGGRFPGLALLEREFKDYATKDHDD